MSDQDEELWASLSLRHGLDLGVRTINGLVEHFGGAVQAARHARHWKSLGLASSRQVKGFLAETWRESAQQELDQARKVGARVLCWSDPAFPSRLRQTGSAPILLYYQGDLSLLNNPSLTMVGSREASRYGIELARRIAGDLSDKGMTIVSGLAFGIDREAHLGGLSGPGSSVAVLGTGIDVLYPSSNRDVWLGLCEKGLVVTEFPPGTKPLGANFPQRNRIMSGLSLGVLVVEAKVKSGSLITARLAMEQGRDVFAVPGPVSLPSYRGCHELINQGAKLVHGAEDILVELAPQIEDFVRGKTDASPHRATAGRGRRPVDAERDAVAQTQRARPARRTRCCPPAEAAQLSRPARGEEICDPAGSPEEGAKAPTAPGASGAQCAHRDAAPAGKAREGEERAASPEAKPASGQAGGLEDEVAQHLAAVGATHIDSLCRVFHVQVAQMSRLLVVLELKGVVRRLPGGYYLTA
ncbi:hypothetical protein JCM15519_32960 [Fundidesulfovibrio butyratiphilus]